MNSLAGRPLTHLVHLDCFLFSAALGFVVEGGFLKINLLHNPYPDWWMGFALAFLLCVAAAVSFWWLDSVIKNQSSNEAQDDDDQSKLGFKAFVVNMGQLLKKPFLTLFCLSLSTEGMILAAFSALLSQVMENQVLMHTRFT